VQVAVSGLDGGATATQLDQGSPVDPVVVEATISLDAAAQASPQSLILNIEFIRSHWPCPSPSRQACSAKQRIATQVLVQVLALVLGGGDVSDSADCTA
jgi:hypothetical protein